MRKTIKAHNVKTITVDVADQEVPVIQDGDEHMEVVAWDSKVDPEVIVLHDEGRSPGVNRRDGSS